MNWNITSDRPVYLQLIEQVELAIVAGEYKAGEKMPSVRDLAANAAVNPNTMQRALQELETRGLINTQRTAGRMITEDTNMIDTLRTEKANNEIAAFLNMMEKLGYTGTQTIALLQKQTEGD